MTDAQVVSRRDTFAGHITLLFGHYNGIGIYLIDARISMIVGKPVSRYQLICLYRQRIAFCAAGVGWGRNGQRSDPFWRPELWCMRTTGMQALRLRIWRRAEKPAKSVFTVLWPIKACFMHITQMTSSAMVVLYSWARNSADKSLS